MQSFDCFRGKTVLITGHTGFKGSWLSAWLTDLGACVVGLSHNIPTSPSMFSMLELNKSISDNRIDIRDYPKVNKLIQDTQPDFVFHMAAQALVNDSYIDPLGTFNINALGTANILECLRGLNKDVTAIMITSDKCYDNVEWVWGYRETDRIGGKDPYSASKGMAELVIKSYINSFFTNSDSRTLIGIARAGNVIGGGDWANGRIVPDCIKSWSVGDKVEIRKPLSTRPWQHVLEPLSGYLHLASVLFKEKNLHGEAFNFGPISNSSYTVGELIEEMKKSWSNVQWVDVSSKQEHYPEAGLLKLNCDKALHHLKWSAVLNFDETVRMTIDWYKEFYQSKNKNMKDFTSNQIKEYDLLASKRNIVWSQP